MAQPENFDQWSGLFRKPELRRQWSAAFLVGVLTLFPLMILVDLYIDEVERAMQGSLFWVRVGRPLADVLVESLNFGRPATAVAPLYSLTRWLPLPCCLRLEWLAPARTAFVRRSGRRWPVCP